MKTLADALRAFEMAGSVPGSMVFARVAGVVGPTLV